MLKIGKFIKVGAVLVGVIVVLLGIIKYDQHRMDQLRSSLHAIAVELETERLARERLELSVQIDDTVVEQLLNTQQRLQQDHQSTVQEIIDYLEQLQSGDHDDNFPDLTTIEDEDERLKIIERASIMRLYDGMFVIYCRSAEHTQRDDPRCTE